MGIEFKKPVILIVDDESDMCEMIAATLYEEGYVSDIVKSGKETLQRIKAIQPGLPVVMITAYATLKRAQEAMSLGAYAYITKPFNLECVREVIKQGIEEQYTNT